MYHSADINFGYNTDLVGSDLKRRLSVIEQFVYSWVVLLAVRMQWLWWHCDEKLFPKLTIASWSDASLTLNAVANAVILLHYL